MPWGDYLQDQTLAGQSGNHLMNFFAGMRPILSKARANGSRIILLAHSMGNWALQGAIESWFAHGQAPTRMFDEVILAAADERHDSFGFPPHARFSGLHLLTKRISVYFSRNDNVLQLSTTVNLGAQRLGQDGPLHRTDTTLFPAERFRMVDCTGFNDYDMNFASSHQYYRRSPGVRADIAAIIADA